MGKRLLTEPRYSMECGAHVGKSFVTYPCSLDKGHTGPCMALENTPSVRQRRAWEQEQYSSGQAAAPAAVMAPPAPEVVVDVTLPSPSDTLQHALDTLAAAASEVERLMGQRATLSGLLDEIEAGLPGDAVEARSAASMLRAMLRA